MVSRIDVMISSTSKDLPVHRQEATDAILRSKMFPVRMEDLTASDGNAVDVSFQMVDVAEIYLGIFGQRYGFRPTDSRNTDNISITEMEYHRAKERGIPIRIFVMDKKHPVTVEEMEEFDKQADEDKASLKAFKDKLMNDHVVGFFESPLDLRAQIIQSLAPTEIKAQAEALSGINDHLLNLPKPNELIRPPELLSLPRYTLTHSFIGREEELTLLDEWSQSSDPMMVVNAIGGMGKSALTWEWVNKEAQKEQFDGRFWFSFYERGTNMTEFVRQALAYVKGVHSDTLKNSSRGEMADELRRELDKKHVLLVLDGLERVLVAYHRIDASQVRDDQVLDRRDTTDPKDGRLLKQLANSKSAKLLLSTRLMPTSLEDGGPIRGVQRYDLAGLLPDDAYTLMMKRGVKPPKNRALMDEFMAQFGYHGLLLNITAGRIKNFFRAPSDFDTWYKIIGKDLRDKDIQKARTKLLKHTFDDLSDEAKKLLSQVACLSDAVDYDTLAVFNPYVDSNKLNEDEQYPNSDEYFEALANFDEILRELTAGGLLLWEREVNSYDLHPVVRGYGFEQLEDKAEAFDTIYNHFEQRSTGSYNDAKSLHDLKIPLEMYRALVGAGKHETAISFFFTNLSLGLLRIPAYTIFHELLESIKISNLLTNIEHIDSSNLVRVIIGYSQSGYPDKAERILDPWISHCIKTRNQSDLEDSLAFVFLTSLKNNSIAIAFRALNNVDTIEFFSRYNSSQTMIFAGYVLIGDWFNSDKLYLQLNTSILDGDDKLFLHLINYRYSFYRNLKLSFDALVESYHRNVYDDRIILTLSAEPSDLAVLYAISERKWDIAATLADETIHAANRSGNADIARFNATRALIHLHQKNDAEARDLIETAIETNLIPANFAHIYNCAAQVYRAWGEVEQAKEYALKAYTYAWADGEPYVRWYDLQEAKKNLDVLGVEHPNLPKYDESKAEKVFMEDEIKAFIEELKAEKEAKDDDETDYFGEE